MAKCEGCPLPHPCESPYNEDGECTRGPVLVNTEALTIEQKVALAQAAAKGGGHED